MPRHGHEGLELTCVLSGSFADGTGAYYPGDLSEPVTDHDKPPLVTGTMKSMTSPTASAPRNRVTRMLVSGR